MTSAPVRDPITDCLLAPSRCRGPSVPVAFRIKEDQQ